MHATRKVLSLAALAGALALPATAAADSIVYVDGGNVWSARPDGSSRVQLTDGGGWHSPTQADDGTIAAVQGTGPITVMARDGRPLHTISTWSARTANGGTFSPQPVQLAFTPDGSKLAYAYVDITCPPGSSCGSYQRSTFYTRADVTEATHTEVWGNEFGSENPEWITNDRALVFGGYGAQVAIDELSGGDYSRIPWLTPETDMGDGELSRDGRRLAATFDYGANTQIVFFSVNGDVRTDSPPPLPDMVCRTSDADERYGDPSWSPDGSAVAFESSAGIQIYRFSKLAADGCELASEASFSATGTTPDWGPADPPAARWQPTPSDPTPGDGGGSGTPGGGTPRGGTPGTGTPRGGTSRDGAPTSGGPGGGGTRSLPIRGGGPARQPLTRGALSVTCTAPRGATCTAVATVKVGRRTLRSTTARARANGRAVKLAPRFSKRQLTQLRAAAKRGRVTATVTLTARAADGRRAATTRHVQLTSTLR